MRLNDSTHIGLFIPGYESTKTRDLNRLYSLARWSVSLSFDYILAFTLSSVVMGGSSKGVLYTLPNRCPGLHALNDPSLPQQVPRFATIPLRVAHEHVPTIARRFGEKSPASIERGPEQLCMLLRTLIWKRRMSWHCLMMVIYQAGRNTHGGSLCVDRTPG